MILKHSNKLKGSNVAIDEYYPKEILEEGKALIPHLKETRQRGRKANIKYNKLIIDHEINQIADLESCQTKSLERVDEEKRKAKKKISGSK